MTSSLSHLWPWWAAAAGSVGCMCDEACSSHWLMTQLTNGQHACVLVFMPVVDILNIPCDSQFVFSGTWWTFMNITLDIVEKVWYVTFHFYKVAQVHCSGEVNMFFIYVQNVLPVYSSAKITKNQASFARVKITNVLPRFLWITVNIQYIYISLSCEQSLKTWWAKSNSRRYEKSSALVTYADGGTITAVQYPNIEIFCTFALSAHLFCPFVWLVNIQTVFLGRSIIVFSSDRVHFWLTVRSNLRRPRGLLSIEHHERSIDLYYVMQYIRWSEALPFMARTVQMQRTSACYDNTI